MFDPSTSVSQLKPAALHQYVVESEEKLWNQSVVFNSSLTNDPSGCSDIGSHLLNSGCAVKEIHGYFSNLEYRKCGLRLAVKQTTFTNLRLVRSEGRDSGIDEGSMLKGPFDNVGEVLQLTVEDFHLLKHAYLCASFPVLGVPTPPSPYSPEPNKSPLHHPGKNFSLETVLASLARPETPYLSDSGIEEADDFSIVPAETLYEHLRRVFHLSAETFRHYEQMILNSIGKKSAPKILIDDLVGQLAALENNSNPFYLPKNFIASNFVFTSSGSASTATKEGYDIWQQMERSHITEMISKFWHFSLPSVNQDTINQLDVVHQEYINLLEKLIRFESQFRYDDDDDIGPPPTSPLSSASVRLLKEFGLRYGIGELYRRIVYLHYLTTHFDTTVWFVQHLNTSVYAVMELLPNKKTQLVMVKKELQILENTVEILIGQASIALTKMKSLYPGNRPPDGVASLIELISLSLRIQSYINIKNVKSLEEHIQTVVQEIFPTTYEAHKMVAMAELKQNKWTEQLSPKLLNMLIGNIRDEVADYKVNYQLNFENFFNITEIAAKSFYSCLMEDVEILLESREHLVDPSDIDLLLLSLAYRLDQLDFDWAKYIPSCNQKWRHHFQGEIFRWLAALKIHTKKLVIESISKDKCEAPKMTLDTSISLGSSSGADDRDRSQSFKSLTPSLTSAFSSISSRSTPSSVVRTSSINESRRVQSIPEKSELSTEEIISTNKKGFTRSFDESSAMLCRASKLSSFNIDSKSLDGYEAEDDIFVSFSGVRHSNSLPDVLSGSYQEEISQFSSRKCIKVSEEISEKRLKGLRKPVSRQICDQSQILAKSDAHSTPRKISFSGDYEMTIDDSSSSTITDDEASSSCDELENGGKTNPYPPLQEINMGGFSFQKWKQSQKTIVSLESNTSSKNIKTTRSLSCDKDPRLTVSVDSNDMDITNGVPKLHDVVVPVSGSAIDVIVIMQRLSEFAENLSHVINGTKAKTSPRYNRIGFVRMNSEDDSLRMCVGEQTEKMHEKFVKILCDVLYVFTDNMICMDLCGTSMKHAQKIAGPQLIEYLQLQRDSGLVWGCRHEAAGKENCLEYIDKSAEYLCDRHESVTQEMCTRINNVSSLLIYLKIYINKLGDIFESNQSTRMKQEQMASHSATVRDGDPAFSTDYEFLDSFKYDAQEEKQLFEQSSPLNLAYGLVASQKVNFVQNAKELCTFHLLAVIRAQCRLLAFRINLFIRDAIPMLLKLKQMSTPIDVCLQPVTNFLKSHMESLHSWLFRDCFGKVMECLWVFIVQDFEEQMNTLRMQDSNTEFKAQQHVHALLHLLKVFNNHGKGIKKDLLLSQSDDVIFKLHLQAMSSMRLITLYQQLITYYDDQECVTSSAIPLQHHLYRDLQKYNKCFSSHALIKWILNNSAIFYKYDYLLSGKQTPTHKDQAVDIAQAMLDLGIITDIDHTSLLSVRDHALSFCSTTDTGSLNFPALTLQASCLEQLTSESEESTPRVSPVAKTILVVECEHEKRELHEESTDHSSLKLAEEVDKLPIISEPAGNNFESSPSDYDITNCATVGTSLDSTVKADSVAVASLKETMTSTGVSLNEGGNASQNSHPDVLSVTCGEDDVHMCTEEEKLAEEYTWNKNTKKSDYVTTLTEEKTVKVASNKQTPLQIDEDGRLSRGNTRISHQHVHCPTGTGIHQTKMTKQNISFVSRSHNSTPNTLKFSDERNAFYCIAPSYYQQYDREFDYKFEESSLVCQCFERKVHANFLLQIIYTRRKQDLAVKKFIKTLSASAIGKVKSSMDLPDLDCELQP